MNGGINLSTKVERNEGKRARNSEDYEKTLTSPDRINAARRGLEMWRESWGGVDGTRREKGKKRGLITSHFAKGFVGPKDALSRGFSPFAGDKRFPLQFIRVSLCIIDHRTRV